MFKKITNKEDKNHDEYLNIVINSDYFTKERLSSIINTIRKGQKKEFHLENNKITLNNLKQSVSQVEDSYENMVTKEFLNELDTDFGADIYSKVFNGLNFEIVIPGSINDNVQAHQFKVQKEVLWLFHFLDINFDKIKNNEPIKIEDYQIEIRHDVSKFNRVIYEKIGEYLQEKFIDYDLADKMFETLLTIDTRLVTYDVEEYKLIKEYNLSISKMKSAPKVNFKRLGTILFTNGELANLDSKSSLLDIINCIGKTKNSYRTLYNSADFDDIWNQIFPEELKYTIKKSEVKGTPNFIRMFLEGKQVYHHQEHDLFRKLYNYSPVKYSDLIIRELFVSQYVLKYGNIFGNNFVLNVSKALLIDNVMDKWLCFGYSNSYTKQEETAHGFKGLLHNQNSRFKNKLRPYNNINEILSAIVYDYLNRYAEGDK